MKKIILSAAAFSMLSASVFAGSLTEPEMEPMVEVTQEDAGSSGGLLIPLLVLVAIGALIATSDDGSGPV